MDHAGSHACPPGAPRPACDPAPVAGGRQLTWDLRRMAAPGLLLDSRERDEEADMTPVGSNGTHGASVIARLLAGLLGLVCLAGVAQAEPTADQVLTEAGLSAADKQSVTSGQFVNVSVPGV